MSYRKQHHSLERAGQDSDSDFGGHTPPGRPPSTPPSRRSDNSYDNQPYQYKVGSIIRRRSSSREDGEDDDDNEDAGVNRRVNQDVDDRDRDTSRSSSQPKRQLIRMNSKLIRPQRDYESDPRKTVFIGRLSSDTTEDTLRKYFDRFGEIESMFLIRDIITGDSRRYAFCEFRRSKDADQAYAEGNNLMIDGRRILVDREFGRTMKGWKPSRLGGGFNRNGQIRFNNGGGRYSGDSSYQPTMRFHNNNNNYNNNNDNGNNNRGYYHNSRVGFGGGGGGGHFRGNHSYQNNNNGGGGYPNRRSGFDDSIRSRMHGSNSGGYGNGYRRTVDTGRR